MLSCSRNLIRAIRNPEEIGLGIVCVIQELYPIFFTRSRSVLWLFFYSIIKKTFSAFLCVLRNRDNLVDNENSVSGMN